MTRRSGSGRSLTRQRERRVRDAADETHLNQTFVRVDAKTYKAFLVILDAPPSGEGYRRLMNASKPWTQ